MHHLYSSLDYCILWPKEMQDLLSLAAIVAFDPVQDFKVPCMIADDSWDYYTKLNILVFLPIVVAFVMSGLSFGMHMTKAHYAHRREATKHKQRRRAQHHTRDAAVTGSDVDLLAMHAATYRLKMRSSARHGMETCVSLICMVSLSCMYV